MRIGNFGKLCFFKSSILDSFFQKQFFLLDPHKLKSVANYLIERMGSFRENFQVNFGTHRNFVYLFSKRLFGTIAAPENYWRGSSSRYEIVGTVFGIVLGQIVVKFRDSFRDNIWDNFLKLSVLISFERLNTNFKRKS